MFKWYWVPSLHHLFLPLSCLNYKKKKAKKKVKATSHSSNFFLEWMWHVTVQLCRSFYILGRNRATVKKKKSLTRLWYCYCSCVCTKVVRITSTESYFWEVMTSHVLSPNNSTLQNKPQRLNNCRIATNSFKSYRLCICVHPNPTQQSISTVTKAIKLFTAQQEINPETRCRKMAQFGVRRDCPSN